MTSTHRELEDRYIPEALARVTGDPRFIELEKWPVMRTPWYLRICLAGTFVGFADATLAGVLHKAEQALEVE